MAGCPAAGQNCYVALTPSWICRQQKKKTWCSFTSNERFVGCAVLSPPGMSTSEIQGDSKPQGPLLLVILYFLSNLQISQWIIPYWPSLPWLSFHSSTALTKTFESKKGRNALTATQRGWLIISAVGSCFGMLGHLSQQHTAMIDGKQHPQSTFYPRSSGIFCDFPPRAWGILYLIIHSAWLLQSKFSVWQTLSNSLVTLSNSLLNRLEEKRFFLFNCKNFVKMLKLSPSKAKAKEFGQI